MNHTTRLRLLREHHGASIEEMAQLLEFESPWDFQMWHQRNLGDIYHPVITKRENEE